MHKLLELALDPSASDSCASLCSLVDVLGFRDIVVLPPPHSAVTGKTKSPDWLSPDGQAKENINPSCKAQLNFYK